MKKYNHPFPRQAIVKNQPLSLRAKILPLLLCLGLPVMGMAEDRVLMPNTTLDYPGTSPALGGLNQLAPFKYIPPAGSAAVPGVDVPQLKPDEQRIADLYGAGDYSAAATAGLALMAKEKTDEGLQLMIANSLAWTGRLAEAAPVYQGLTKAANGRYADAANLGLANLQRWSGRDDQAAPIYRSVLARDPGNADALAGLTLAGRELSPRTTLSLGGSSDSTDEQRRFATINHRWRDASGARIFEVETSRVRDELPGVKEAQQDASLRYQDLNMAFKPRFELSMPTQDNRTLFGSVGLSLDEDHTSLHLGRVNWGRIAVNPNALALGLTAVNLGAGSWHDFSFGRLSGRLNYYRISDDNTILSTGLNLDTAWRPLGKAIKPYVGMETREAKFNAPNYWSPEQGSGTAYAGLKGEWSATDWSLYSSAQLSRRLFGDAGNGWSVSAGGKRWIAKDVAISMNLWAMSSRRDNAAYRARSVSVNLEKLWN